MAAVRQIEEFFQKRLRIFDNPVIYTVTVMFIGLYASVIAPRLGPGIKGIFDSTLFKILFFFLVIVLSHHEPRLALILAMAFVFSIQNLTKWNVMDRWNIFSGPKTLPAPKNSHTEASPPMVDLTQTAEIPAHPAEYDEIEADDGTAYVLTGETEASFPLHPDLVHSSAQALGDPIPGYDESSHLNPSPF